MKHEFEYWHGAVSELPSADSALVEAARSAAERAYAPITHFGVGAAARLRSGRVVVAWNIESPIGVQSICAERNLLLQLDPADPIDAMAIAARAGAGECYPCGVCRQAMIEAQSRQGSPMRIIMSGPDTATAVDDAALLLPFAFTM